MKYLLIAILLGCSQVANSQSIDKSDIIGQWTVTKGKTTSSDLPTDVNQMMTMMINGFDQSVWTFNSNGRFRIEFTKELSPVMEEMKFLDNKLWKYIDSSNLIKIGTKEDNFNHLVLSAKAVESDIEIQFSDTPIILTLRKK